MKTYLQRRNYFILASLLLGLAAALIIFPGRGDTNSQPLATAAKIAAGSGVELTNQHWSYMPGVQTTKKGLIVSGYSGTIVEQDGSGGQANPPVNLYGTHLSVSGAFSITSILSDINGPADVQFYGKVPLIADEFRVEPPSIRFEVRGHTLHISQWDGSIKPDLATSLPVSTATYNLPNQSGAIHLVMIRQNGKLLVSVNDKQIASLKERNIFSAGNVWFGLNTQGGAYRLSSLKAQALAKGTVHLVDSSSLEVNAKSATTLQALAAKKRPGFLVGAAMALAPSVADNQYARVAYGGQFGSMTTENALKWQFIEPQNDHFYFQEADALVNIARQHNMVVNGHTLVFSEANPTWVQSLPTDTAVHKQQAQAVMDNHISTSVSHFKGRIASWDVIDEPLKDDINDPNGQVLRENKWYQAMGRDYIAEALKTAHQTDPKTQLYINEYGLEADGSRWDAFIKLVSELKTQNVPLDGVGFESHVYTSGDFIDTSVLQRHISQLAQLGLKSRISEMDVYDDDGVAVQGRQFSQVFQACLSKPSCVSFTTWGVTDRYDMFQNNKHQLQHGNDLLWDNKVRPTAAYQQTVQSL